VYRRDLGEDVGAIAILLDHALQAPYLALDPAQTLEIPVFDLWIDRDGDTDSGFVLDLAPAPCRMILVFVVSHGRLW
jgi:hypothetical protein